MEQRPDHLTDESAREILRRAAEIDLKRSAITSAADLRQVAIDAGISPGAVDAALDEWRQRTRAAALSSFTQPARPRRNVPALTAFVAVLAFLGGILATRVVESRDAGVPAVAEQPVEVIAAPADRPFGVDTAMARPPRAGAEPIVEVPRSAPTPPAGPR